MLMMPATSSPIMLLGWFIYILVIAALVLSIAALWKYVTHK